MAEPVVCTADSRPAAPDQDALILERDTGRVLRWMGQQWADDIVGWLRAQIDEDERVAQAVLADTAAHGYLSRLTYRLRTRGGAVTTETEVVVYDPARVLREVEANRLLLDLHKECTAQCYVVRVLALPYAHLPGYQEEWRP